MTKPVNDSTRSATSRRAFLQTGVIGGISATLYPALSTARATETFAPQNARPDVPAFELEEMTIDQLQADMKSGKLKPIP